jgi:hypothetical protein
LLILSSLLLLALFINVYIYFSRLFVLMELLLLLLLLLLFPCFCILFVCVCFLFSTRAQFLIGLWAVKLHVNKLNWIELLLLSPDRVTIDGFWIWWLYLIHTLLQRVTTIYSSLLNTHTHTSVHSHIFTAVAWYRFPNAGRSLSSMFSNWPRPGRTLFKIRGTAKLHYSSHIHFNFIVIVLVSCCTLLY